MSIRRMWIKRFGSRKLEREFNEKWGDLAYYNSERARGLNHSPEYVAKMEAKQAAYHEWIKETKW